MEILWTLLTPGSISAHSAWPASWKATTRRSWSVRVRRDCMPATTRSRASSKSFCSICVRKERAAKMAASLQTLARSAPARPAVWRAIMLRSTSSPSGLLRQWTCRISSRPATPGGETKIWRSKRPGAQQRRVERVEQVGRGDDDDVVRRAHAVHLDQQLVEGLLALRVVVRAARLADGVDLVDEDDARGALAGLGEQAADAGRAEAGEHLHEARRGLREELGARLTRDGLGQQRLAGAGRAVEDDARGDLRAERRRSAWGP